MTPNFTQTLALILTLETDGKEQKIYPNDIHAFNLKLHTYGYTAIISISNFNEPELDSMLQDTKVLTATLEFLPLEPEDSDPFTTIKGTVTETSYQFESNKHEKAEGMVTLWDITFKDNAQAMWSEHYPQNIYVDKTMKDVFDEHKTPDIDLTYEWDELEESYPILAFSLEEKAEIPQEQRPQFYSFLHWYLHKENGLFLFDYEKHTYTFYSEKPPIEGDPFSLNQEYLTSPKCQTPKIIRYTKKELTHDADSLEDKPEEAEEGFDNIRKDFIDLENRKNFPEHFHGSVNSLLHPEKPLLNFSAIEFEEEFHLDKILPGAFIDFESHEFQPGYWSQNKTYKEKKFRIRSLTINAKRQLPAEGVLHKKQPYTLEVNICAEDEEEKQIDRPAFNPPTYPFSIQGKIFCEIGEKEQTTFNLDEEENHYQVTVPLALDEKLIVPFFPEFMTGQHYYPLCKDQQVLLSVYFRTAKIQRVLDWQPHAKLPSSTQGNQFVLGSNGANEFVIIKHEFEGEKDSVYTLTHSTAADQQQIVRIEKESVHTTVVSKNKTTSILQTHEKIESKLEDKDAKLTQTILFDGKDEIKTSCKKGDDESILSIKSKSITLQSTEINLKVDEAINLEGDTYSAKMKTKAVTETKMIHHNAKSVKNGP
ncbi:MAG: hypothetical protein ChlgKO_01320 [Chlamydiales bacterium]